MKIEIEFREVERMKNEISSKEKELMVLRAELLKLDAQKLKADSVNLAMDLFESYIKTVFEKLGFNKPNGFYNRAIIAECGLQRLGQTSPFDSDKVKFSIEAQIANDFRQAFLRMGLITEEESL